MKITVITICYNDLVGLKKTVESVLKQDYRNVEYIIVDGASTDGSVDYLQSISEVLDTLISEPDRGIYHAMNKGIALATGEYIIFMNAGDIFSRENVLSEVIDSGISADFVYGNAYFNYGLENVLVSYPNQLTFSFLMTSALSHQSLFTKKSVFEKCGMYQEKYKLVADWEHYFRIFKQRIGTFQAVPIPISVYDTSGVSSDYSDESQLMQERREVMLELLSEDEMDLFVSWQNERKKLRKEVAELKSMMLSFPVRIGLRINRIIRKARSK